MQNTCPLSGLRFQANAPFEIFATLNAPTLYPLFSLPITTLTAIEPTNLIEAKLLIVATLHKLGIFAPYKSEGENIPSSFFALNDSLPYTLEILKGSREVLAAFLAPSKKDRIEVTQIKPYALTTLKKVAEILREIKGSLAFRALKVTSTGAPIEALLSNEASKFYASLSKEEVTYTLDKFSKDNSLVSEVSLIKNLAEKSEPTKEEVANASLAIITCMEVLDQTSVEDVSLVHIFKAMLEGKKTIELTRSKIGNLHYWIGLYKEPSVLATTNKKGSALERLKALTEGKGNITPTLANDLALSISADEL